MEDALTGVANSKLIHMKDHFESELQSTYFVMMQVNEPNILGRHQGRAEYLHRLIKMCDYIIKGKKRLDN
tara:strand:+ start:8477 stop:8686 length:210 start_codon:yes stop_codon:yes gene_type:complete